MWVSPAGRTYRTVPAGADLFPQPHRPACAAPAPDRRRLSQQRANRIARRRRHNRRQRHINEARRALELARNEEIAARKFRKSMWDKLFAFKGEPGTSPFCRWVNDPREPEELPADWTPEPTTRQPPPDDPPF